MPELYADPSTVNYTKGLDQLFIYVQQEVPIFIPMVLLGFFIIILMAGFNSEQRREGSSSFSKWFAIAGFATTLVVFSMSIIDGLITLVHLGIVLTISFIGVLWFLISDNNQ